MTIFERDGNQKFEVPDGVSVEIHYDSFFNACIWQGKLTKKGTLSAKRSKSMVVSQEASHHLCVQAGNQCVLAAALNDVRTRFGLMKDAAFYQVAE